MFFFFLLLFGSHGGSQLLGRTLGLGSPVPLDADPAVNESVTTNAAAGGNFDGGWLSRLGWGLGEASVEALGVSPTRTFDARVAFFGRSIPNDGMTGWLVPLDEILGPCDSTDSSSSSNPPRSRSPATSNLPPPFLGLDAAYVPLDVDFEHLPPEDDIPPAQSENTGCPPLCPIYSKLRRYQKLGTDLAERDGKDLLDDVYVDDGESEPDSEPNEGLPEDAKEKDEYHPFPQNTTWVALVLRGECDFATKAMFAQELGASALIVGGLDDNLISMSARGSIGAGSKIIIPSVFIGKSSYQNLTHLIVESDVRLELSQEEDMTSEDGGDNEQGVKTILIALHGEPPWEWYTPILSLLVVLSLPSLLTLCTLLIHRLRAEQHARRERAPEDVVRSLEERVWHGAPSVGWVGDGRSGEKGSRVVTGVPATGTSETTPLIARNESKEDEIHQADAGYGATGEPSTSMPRTGIHPQASRRSGSTDEDDSLGQQSERRNTFELTPTSDSATATPIARARSISIVTSASARQARNNRNAPKIPRPPWFDTQTECAICLCDFETGDRVRVLPCGHIFHLEEVDPWLIKQRKVCPVCKYDVTNPPTAMVPAESANQSAIAFAAADSSDNVEANREEVNAPNAQPAEEGQRGLLHRINLPNLSDVRTWVARLPGQPQLPQLQLRGAQQPEEQQGQGQRQRQRQRQDVESRGEMPVNEPLRP